MAQITIELDGIQRASAFFRATPKQIQRATVNAINTTGSSGRKRIIKTIRSGTGVKAKHLRKALELKRVNLPKRDFALVQASGQRIPIPEWRFRVVQSGSNPTRAYIEVQRGIDGDYEIVYGFVNPLGAKQLPLQRRAKGARQILESAPGVSIIKAFSQSTDDATREQIAVELSDNFNLKLQQQLQKAAR